MTSESLGTKTILGLQATGHARDPHDSGRTDRQCQGYLGGDRALGLDRPADSDQHDPHRSHDGHGDQQRHQRHPGEPDASLFQVPSDYKVETGKPGDMMYMPAKP